MQDFKEIFKNDCKSYKQVHLQNLKEKIDHLIESSDWECDEVIESDYSMSEITDCIIYYVTGFICRKYLKKTKCERCREAFSTRYENVISGCQESQLVALKSLGGLIHPNLHLVRLYQKIENHFQNHLDSGNIYHEVLSELSEGLERLTFPCEEHMDTMVPSLIHYYLLVRMRQFSKLKNKEEKKQSRNKKKLQNYMTVSCYKMFKT